MGEKTDGEKSWVQTEITKSKSSPPLLFETKFPQRDVGDSQKEKALTTPNTSHRAERPAHQLRGATRVNV